VCVKVCVKNSGCDCDCVMRIGQYTFSIGDTSDFSDYVEGGIATEVKMSKTFKFVS